MARKVFAAIPVSVASSDVFSSTCFLRLFVAFPVLSLRLGAKAPFAVCYLLSVPPDPGTSTGFPLILDSLMSR
jgi:hypothetical protein